MSGLIKYLTKHDEDIASIDIYYIEELTNLVFDNQNSKIKIYDLTKTI